MPKKQRVTVEGHVLELSNLEKVLYPAAGFTKAHVIDYYTRVSPYLLPRLEDRPVTLKRFPDGVRGQHFYEKNAPSYTPRRVKTYPVPRRSGDSAIRYILINDLATLVWCANLANLEIHPFLHRIPKIDSPTVIVFDLDPGEGADILRCAQVAFLLKDVFDRRGLQSFPKVSGSKGMQLCIPLNSGASYETTGPFARTVAEYLEKQHPKLVVSEMSKSLRKGKVFIDWSQNADHKTTVAVYSLRAKHERPYVSLPVTWDELHRVLQKKDKDALYFAPAPALKRLEQVGDLFAPVLKLKQQLPREMVLQHSGKELETYRAKRDFSKTPEPPPAVARAGRQDGGKRFVIQKHAASRLHYDFRLEMHGVLKSWAVPKGVPYDLGERRLAMATEDHPIEYLEFEGIIPKGQYGGGTVMVWDIGTYELIDGNYYKGKLHVLLKGKKLKGEWLLTKPSGNSTWFLIKVRSAAKRSSPRQESASALTGRTMEQIAAAAAAEWQSNRTALPKAS